MHHHLAALVRDKLRAVSSALDLAFDKRIRVHVIHDT